MNMLAMAGPVVAVGLVLSPRLGQAISSWMADARPVPARVMSCAPQRDGVHGETKVICRFTYRHQGKSHVAESTSWNSQSPFLTSAALTRVLARQSAASTRRADISPDDPSDARLLDQRWVAMPPLWAWLLALFAVSIVVIFRLDPSDIPYRRAELAPDPSTGQLVPINHHRRDRVRRRLAGQGLAALLAGGICLFGLSNQPANIVAKLAMTALQPTPARLVNCDHHYYRAGRGGHDQLDCDFVYRSDGRTYRGRAESLRFGLIPTDARMDAQVAGLRPRKAVTAYVDRRYPGYAWAFISEKAFIPFTWGLFEVELVLLILVMNAILIACIVRWHRAC